MTYAVKEIFRSLQGEGYHVGRPAVFVRFTGCNGWSGREEDRGRGPLACSAWCDTEFRGTDGQYGGIYTAARLAAKCAELWGAGYERRWLICTGGEPLLQLDHLLIETFHRFGFSPDHGGGVAIETNGTRPAPHSLQWVTVSPKPGLPLVQTSGDELKLVYPQPGVDPAVYTSLSFQHFFLQPMDGPDREANTRAAVEYCLAHPQWRLSLQTHKVVGLP